ncbi:NAD(P)-dependent oxidoreductase, partial [Aquibacillus salsiterrae]
MQRPKVYITRKIDDAIVSKISEKCEVTMWGKEDEPVPREVLLEKVKQIDGLFCLLTETIDAAVLQEAKHLKVISNMAVGYNNIDVDCAKRRGIIVTNTPEVLTETTADLTFGLLLTVARRLIEATDYVKQGNWKTWSPMELAGQDVYGATLGIIGMGRIGQAVARRARGFSMKIIYHNRQSA